MVKKKKKLPEITSLCNYSTILLFLFFLIVIYQQKQAISTHLTSNAADRHFIQTRANLKVWVALRVQVIECLENDSEFNSCWSKRRPPTSVAYLL